VTVAARLAVILDMDGLLLDTEPIARRAWKAAGAERGLALTRTLFLEMTGCNNQRCREVLREAFGTDCPADEIADRAAVIYQDRLDRDGVPAKIGAVEFLTFLEARAVPRAVATSTATDLARHKLERAGLGRFVPAVIGADQVSRGKPAPDIFLRAVGILGVTPDACLVFEDSAPGMAAAAAAGIRAVLIPDDGEPSPGVRASAYAELPSLVEAIPFVERLLLDLRAGDHFRAPS
jgi:beta-phosphoglucomutase-like phosphatase (HAD superfamily)